MKMVRNLYDLQACGLHCLTGEACGLGLRLLFDLTEGGKKIVEKCFDVKIASEPWNGGSDADPHVASIMIAREMFLPLGIFALLESGCTEVWIDSEMLFGVESDDKPEYLELVKKDRPNIRRYAYRGTAGSRNQHVFTGRIV